MLGAPISNQLRITIEDPSGVAEARRQAASLAASCGLAEPGSGALALCVTEAGTNIVKHAVRGEILIRAIEEGATAGVEVIALDKGPGIADVAHSMRDGHSTAGSPGTGLGTLQRMTSGFEIYSRPGNGTIVRFEVWQRSQRPAKCSIGAICLPMEGEVACGDSWTILEAPGRRVVFVVDGLGHGTDAAAAARAAVAAVSKHHNGSAADVIAAVDAGLRSTRGAAACVAVMQRDSGICMFCGVGNIAANIHAGGASRSMVSHNGILGHQVRKIQEFQYPLPRDALCIMHSDGLATRWTLDAYPGLQGRHPSLVAAALYRDHSRGRDDVTVLSLPTE